MIGWKCLTSTSTKMTKTLFLGDSHSHGYFEMGGKVNAWESNNYAEIYALENNKQTVIYSMPGGCNRKYPAWLRTMLDRYNDIDEVFVQSTYWNRYLLSCSKNLGVGEETTSSLYLDEDQPKDNLIERYTDHRITENYIEMVEQTRHENYEEFKGFAFNDMKVGHDFKPFHEKYSYTKLWHELVTPLQYKDYCIDLLAIDTMCKERDIKWYLWTINNRVFVPENIDYFGKLSCIRAETSAEVFLKEHCDMDIETDKYRLDGEHYIKEVHSKIAKEYFGYLKGVENA